MQRSKAFTLIELLVVIAIIAILAAILFPVFAQAKVAAKGAASLSNMKQQAIAQQMYANDYDDWLVYGWWEPSATADGNATHWVQRVLPYIKNDEIFVDPSGPDVYPKDM
ncbi:MAG: prepilin-type N-terminal cleavage/methylation domain-containing protein, partial [Fimbriimonadaceae bacterium]